MSGPPLREHIARMGRAIYEWGYVSGSSGNISVRIEDGYLMTPTNSCLGMLDPSRISSLDKNGSHISGDKPSKEVIFHLAMYRRRPNVGDVVHLHAPWATALSCLKNLDPDNALPPLTPYFVMRIGRLPMVPYFRPGDSALAEAVARQAQNNHAILPAHHGLIVGGRDLDDAVYNAEELEETAHLYLMLQDKSYRTLNAEQVAEPKRVFPKKI